MRNSWLYQTSTGLSATSSPANRPVGRPLTRRTSSRMPATVSMPSRLPKIADGRVGVGESKQSQHLAPIVQRDVVDRRMFLLDQLKGDTPGVARIGPGPVEADRLVEPDAVVVEPPQARQRGQRDHQPLGQVRGVGA